MAISARIRELAGRHTSLDKAIHDEMTRPKADETRLRDLKRRKLLLKEEIEKLKARAH